ncbi:hypothetical protein DY000_02014515 [Brassica cretica]|uniref:Uncharacterized protein n=1 Tax=Brassica cretica TaxID=69181 RepID=A0ABQ7CY22_BRACR|nr:hypothetical protein DY000_02014515 [Brassica cretica]
MTTAARPQRIKTGMRHKAGMGSYVNPASPDVESSVPIVLLPKKAEYGPCEKQNILGSQGTPGPYASPRSKEETQGSKEEPPGSYVASGFQRQKEVRTSVQPRAHRGHYNFKEPPGSKQRSLDPNLRVPTRPQRPKYNFRKKDRTPVQPRAHRGHYIPKEPSGSHTNSGSKYTRVPMRSPNLKKKLCTFVRPQGPITITETSGFQPTISGSVIESPGSYTASGLRSRSQDLE